MLHSISEFWDRHYLAISIINWITVLSISAINLRVAMRKPEHELDVTLGPDTMGDDPLTITVVKRSSKAAPIRKVELDIYSEDLTRHKRLELSRRVVLWEKIDERLTSYRPVTFSLKHRYPDRDSVYPLTYRELAADLQELGIEIAQVTGVVRDQKNQPYRSNTLAIRLYQMALANGDTWQTNPHATTA